MPLPGTNTFLISVHPAGAVDRYGDPSAAGVASWTGRVPCYLSRSRIARTEAGDQVLVKITTLDAFTSEGAPVTPVAGPDWLASTIVVEDASAATQSRFTVVGYERKGQGTVADKIRLELDNEATV